MNLIKTVTHLCYIFGLIAVSSCTEVIDINLKNTEPRLIIEASIDWEAGTSGADQAIKLSMSTPVFDQQETTVTGATVTITNNQTSDVFAFTDQNNGSYETNSFVPVLNQTYTLEVNYNSEKYTAEETLLPLTNEVRVFQSTNKFNKDLLEVNVEFQDELNNDNYYMIKFKAADDLLPSFSILSDERIDGNFISIPNERQEDEDIDQVPYSVGSVVQIDLYAISERYFEYFDLLDDQLSGAGNPFSTTPVEIKGNITNETNLDNPPFGAFRLSSSYKEIYEFE